MNKLLAIGALVLRIEPPINGTACITALDESNDPPFFLLAYAEGGEGWWPLNSIEAIPRDGNDPPP